MPCGANGTATRRSDDAGDIPLVSASVELPHQSINVAQHPSLDDAPFRAPEQIHRRVAPPPPPRSRQERQSPRNERLAGLLHLSDEKVDVLLRAAVVDDAGTQAKRTVDRCTGQESGATQLDDFQEPLGELVQLLLVVP